MLAKIGRRREWLLWALVLALVVLGGSGCTRRFFRKAADREVNEILAEKDREPFWKIENFHVYPNPRARFADPTNPDRPPMPPDDPAAHYFAPYAQKPPHRGGIARIEGTGYLDLLATWDTQNRALRGEKVDPVQSDLRLASYKFTKQNPVEPEEGPQPRQLPEKLAKLEPRPFLIKLDQAMELAVINSREFQNRREDLYLAALPVTLERFAFAPQAFLAEEAIRERTGRQSSVGQQNRWRFNSDTGFSKLFSTGALLLVSFANRTAIDLTGNGPHTTSVSDVNLDLVQPLLRGGGRAVTLEPLTQAERNLLYEIRSYARFRKEFFNFITGGGNLGTPLVFTSGLGRNALAPGSVSLNTAIGVRPQLLPGAAGRIDLAVGAVADSQGYLPTLTLAAAVNNSQKNVRNLEKILQLFRAYEEGGEVGSLQVGQVEQDLLSSRSRLLQDQRALRDALDIFKTQLGIPLNLLIDLDDAPIQPITRQLENLESTIQQAEELSVKMERSDVIEEAAQMRQRVRDFLTNSALVKGTKQFRANLPLRWGAWEKLKDEALEKKLEGARIRRRQLLDLKVDLEQREKKLSEKEQLELAELERDIPYGDLEFALRRYLTQPWKNLPNEKDRRKLHEALFREIRKGFDQILGDVVQERLALIRPGWPALPPLVIDGVDLLKEDLETAFAAASRHALANRLDLMNARAEVNDTWRQITIFANSLLGVLNVGYHMDSTTAPDPAKPLAFQASRTRHQLFLNAELPLVRLAERNNYRASLIAYQRARRLLQEAEDLVVAQVRADLRSLRFLAENFTIQQRAVEVAYTQLDSSLDTFRAPPQVGAGAQGAGSITALTQQLLNAQRNLPQVQNQLYATWVNYLVGRQQLFLDLEAMPLDFRGVWIDEYADRFPQLQTGDAADGSSPTGNQGATFQGTSIPGTLPERSPVSVQGGGPRFLPPAEVLPPLVR